MYTPQNNRAAELERVPVIEQREQSENALIWMSRYLERIRNHPCIVPTICFDEPEYEEGR